jgi:hypothetical protein
MMLAPWDARVSAMAAPIPLVEPVMRAVLPLSMIFPLEIQCLNKLSLDTAFINY